jgi:hypothetical protein
VKVWVRFAHFSVRGTLWNILEGSGARWVRSAHFALRGTLWNILEGLGALETEGWAE